MIYDGINLLDGSKFSNVIIESAENFPLVAFEGQLFYLLGSNEGLYVFDGDGWLKTAGDYVVTGDVSGTIGDSSSELTLATVNSSPQSNSFRKITVNGKGLITATSAVSAADVIDALEYTPVNKAGDTMTGLLSLSADPSSPTHAATKLYVDTIAQGLVTKPSVAAATTSNLSATYNNGTSGVGATLTGSGDLPVIDGVSLSIGQGILVRAQTSQLQNGRYNVTVVSPNWVLTRCGVCDQPSEIPGAYVFVNGGTQFAATGWVQTVSNPSTFQVGVDPISVIQFAGAGTYTGGTGIGVNGTVINNTGVTSISGTSNEIEVSASTGAVTVGLPNDVTITGQLTVGSAFDSESVELGWKSIPRSTTTGTAVIDDKAKAIAVSSNITIPANVFAAGDCVSIYNNSASSITITQGSGLTLRLVGTATTGNRTLAQRGFATVWFNSATEGVVSGGGLS